MCGQYHAIKNGLKTIAPPLQIRHTVDADGTVNQEGVDRLKAYESRAIDLLTAFDFKAGNSGQDDDNDDALRNIELCVKQPRPETEVASPRAQFSIDSGSAAAEDDEDELAC